MTIDNWTTPKAIQLPGGEYVQTDDAPTIAYSPAGNILMCAFEGLYDPYVWYTISHDQGNTWGPAYKAHPDIRSHSGLALSAYGSNLVLVFRGENNKLYHSEFFGSFTAPHEVTVSGNSCLTTRGPTISGAPYGRWLVGWKPIEDVHIRAGFGYLGSMGFYNPNDVMSGSGPAVAFGEKSGNESLFRMTFRGLQNTIWFCDGPTGSSGPPAWQVPYTTDSRQTNLKPTIAYNRDKEMWYMAWADSSGSGKYGQICADYRPEGDHWHTPWTELGSKGFWTPSAPALCPLPNKFAMAWRGFSESKIWLSTLSLP